MASASIRRVFGGVVFGLVVAVAVGPAVAPAGAQEEAEAPDQEQQAPEGEEPRQAEEDEPSGAVLEEIVVTARKRAEDPQKVPVSLSTIDTEKLDAFTVGGQDIRFLSGRVPSLVMESSFGRAFPRFYIRGLGNTDFDLNASQPVSLVYDEIVLENPVLKGMPVWDMERVEVLRGPQGTLFGRNTPAGIVKFDSRKPTWEPEGFVRGSLGTYETGDVRAAVGGPLSEHVAYRFSTLFQTREDWVDNEYEPGPEDALGGYQTGAARLQFLYEPDERFSGLLNLHGWDVNGTARIFRANILQPGTNDLVDDFEHDRVFHDGFNTQQIESYGGVLKLDYDLGGVELTSVTGYETLEMYSRGDIDGGFGADFIGMSGPGSIPFFSETADGLPELDQFTQELRLASVGDRRLHWLVGAFYFDEDLTVDTFSYDSLSAGNPQDGFAFQTQQAEAWALFGSLDWQVSDRWNLRAGLRHSQDDKDFAAERPDPTFNTPTVAPITRSTDADFTSWDLSATYTVSPDVIVYGRAATSFRAPSIQGRILFCPDFAGGADPATNCVSVADEEDILSTELGFKSELFDRRLRLNMTAYRYTVDGQQIVAVGGQFNTATLLNADETEGYGFEADMEIAPSPEWLITLGVSNNNTEIQDEDLAVAPCGGGCTVLDPIGPNGALVDGNSLPHAPEWIANGIIDYRKPTANGLFFGSADFAYYSEKQFFLYESEEFRANSFEVNLRLGYTFKDAKYDVALWGKNVTDEEIVRNGIDFNNLTGMVNDPATWGVELVTRW